MKFETNLNHHLNIWSNSNANFASLFSDYCDGVSLPSVFCPMRCCGPGRQNRSLQLYRLRCRRETSDGPLGHLSASQACAAAASVQHLPSHSSPITYSTTLHGLLKLHKTSKGLQTRAISGTVSSRARQAAANVTRRHLTTLNRISKLRSLLCRARDAIFWYVFTAVTIPNVFWGMTRVLHGHTVTCPRRYPFRGILLSLRGE